MHRAYMHHVYMHLLESPFRWSLHYRKVSHHRCMNHSRYHASCIRIEDHAYIHISGSRINSYRYASLILHHAYMRHTLMHRAVANPKKRRLDTALTPDV